MAPTDLKKSRKTLKLEQKYKWIQLVEGGVKKRDVCAKYGVKPSSLRTIVKNKDKIRTQVQNSSDLANRKTAYSRAPALVLLEKALLIWIEDNTRKKLPMSGELIKEKALRLYNAQKMENPSLTTSPDFCASNGWFDRFRNRHSLKNIKMKGESASADKEAAERYPPELKQIIENGGYTADQVTNADETGLNWKRMPSRTYTLEGSAAGYKEAKERITLMFCCNASGDKLFKPLVINNALRPRSMKGMDMNELSVHWRANRKAWMTRAIFTDWFHNCYVPEMEVYLESKNLPFKALLLLDNASSHLEIEHPNVQFAFLPPNTTSLIQPLDQGSISVFKKLYVKQAFTFILDQMEKNPGMKVQEVWKKFTMKNCVEYVAVACAAIKKTTLNRCWKNIWPEVVDSNIGSQDCLDSQIKRLGTLICGGEFADKDLEEMLASESLDDADLLEILREMEELPTENLSEEEEADPQLFEVDQLLKGMHIAEQLIDHFIDNDPHLERAVAFKNEINSAMARYFELMRSSNKILESALGE